MQSSSTYIPITASKTDIAQKPWQEQLAHTINHIDTLCQFLAIDPDALLGIHQPDLRFGLKVPYAFAQKIKKGDLFDPLLLQILPTKAEHDIVAGFVPDPLAEHAHNPIDGLLHKYPSRVLLPITGACAVHCRYCFRRHFDYQSNLLNAEKLNAIITYINQNPTIDEVILSGGDPLSVSNRRLFDCLEQLDNQTNIKTIRLHTRLPIVLPARVDEELLAFLTKINKNIIIVVHTNHANELDDTTKGTFFALKKAGVTLLNQTVLLKNINDNAQTLSELSHALFDCGVLPYYLHLLDKVQGAAHFEVDEACATKLYWQLLSVLPGYLVPKLVKELPGHLHKTPVDIYKYEKIH